MVFSCVCGLLVTIAGKAECRTVEMSLFVAQFGIKFLYVVLHKTYMLGNIQNRRTAIMLVGLEQNWILTRSSCWYSHLGGRFVTVQDWKLDSFENMHLRKFVALLENDSPIKRIMTQVLISFRITRKQCIDEVCTVDVALLHLGSYQERSVRKLMQLRKTNTCKVKQMEHWQKWQGWE